MIERKKKKCEMKREFDMRTIGPDHMTWTYISEEH